MTTEGTTQPFELAAEYSLWSGQWATWWESHRHRFDDHCDHNWPRPNIMATAVLGHWHINDRCVELSDVLLYSPGSTTRRRVGVTYRDRSTGSTIPVGLMPTFAALEAELWPDGPHAYLDPESPF